MAEKKHIEIIGRIYQLKGDYEHAKKNLEKALLLKNLSSHIFLMQIYFIEEDFENIIRISNCQREFNCFSLAKIGLAYIKLNQEKKQFHSSKKH